jgi:recombination protein RecA
MARQKAATKLKEAPKPPSELDETLAHAKKRYGESFIRKGTEIHQPDRIPTGVFVMDYATLGGFSHNRASMIVGQRHSGKSLLSSKLIASTQKLYPDQVALLLDIEGTFEPVFAEALGVDLDRLKVVEVDTGEMAVDIVDAVLSSAESSMVVVDSLAAMIPCKEAESSAEDAHVGLQSRLISGMVRKVTNVLVRERRRNHLVTPIYVNQFRSKIGGFQKFGEPLSIPGGKALEYCTSVQIIMKNKENKGKAETGLEMMTTNDHSYSITKNKINNGPRSGEFVLVREDGIVPNLGKGDVDNAPTILSYAKRFGLYTGAGTKQTLEFDDVKLSFGKQDLCIAALREDRDLQWQLRNYLIALEALRQRMPKEFCNRILQTPNVT